MVVQIDYFYCCSVVVRVMCLFLAVLWVGLQCMTVEFPGNTHLPLLGVLAFFISITEYV